MVLDQNVVIVLFNLTAPIHGEIFCTLLWPLQENDSCLREAR
jgi:hypothetical protein